MKQRSKKLELIDLGPSYYTAQEYQECLYYLSKINNILGGTRALLKAIHAVTDSPKSILDIGCGGGGVTKQIAQAWPSCQVTGIDISADAISYAQVHNSLPNVEYRCVEKAMLDEPDKSFDLVVTTLVCHHLTDDQIVAFFDKALHVARCAVIINDVHRSWLAYMGFKVLAALFFNNRLIRADGPLSICRGFVYRDFIRYIHAVGLDQRFSKIEWWPLFRWVVTLYPQ